MRREQLSAPYQMRFSHFQFPQNECQLPFALGGATQHKPNSTTESRNSQDAITLRVAEDLLVAVISDGCSGTHPELEFGSESSNDFGAKLLCYIVCEEITKTVAQLTSSVEESEMWLDALDRSVTKKLRLLMTTLAGRDARVRERFIFDFLMATIVCVVATTDAFIVFHSGDGIIGVNGEVERLEAHAGRYLANRLVARPASDDSMDKLHLYAAGPIDQLDSVFIATDGLYGLSRKHPEQLEGFIRRRPTPSQVEAGVDLLITEFRQAVAWNDAVETGLEDEATFALLRRIAEE